VWPEEALHLAKRLQPGQIHLLLFDPPYYGVVKDSWDHQWKSVEDYVEWFLEMLRAYQPALHPTASVVFFGGVGRHGERPLFEVMRAIEKENLLHYRNLITWKKRRAYGKSHDYLFVREEIVWYSVSEERTAITFNVPYLAKKREYSGWKSSSPAKSPYLRVGNVWEDITELFAPKRICQKPLPLMDRLVLTHSNPGDWVCDPFVGWGTTGMSALRANRRFIGGERIVEDADAADARCRAVAEGSAEEQQRLSLLLGLSGTVEEPEIGERAHRDDEYVGSGNRLRDDESGGGTQDRRGSRNASRS
jgi:DNA modification methylase